MADRGERYTVEYVPGEYRAAVFDNDEQRFLHLRELAALANELADCQHDMAGLETKVELMRGLLDAYRARETDK